MIQLDERVGAEPKRVNVPNENDKRKKKTVEGNVEDGAQEDNEADTDTKKKEDI